MKKLILYPYLERYYPLVKFFHMQSTFELIAACSYSGASLSGHDVGYAGNQPPLEIQVCSADSGLLPPADILLVLPDTYNTLAPDSLHLMSQAAKLNKEIICYAPVTDEQIATIRKQCVIESQLHLGRAESEQALLRRFEAVHSKALYTLETPLIYIAGLQEDADQEGVLTALTDQFRKNSYAVCSFGTQDYLHLLGIHSFRFIDDPKPEQCAFHINHFIKAAEASEQPDIMLVQIPGTLFRSDNRVVGDLGQYAHLFSQLFLPDYLICTVTFGTYGRGYVDALEQSLERKYDFPLDALHISNKYINHERSYDSSHVSYYRTTFDMVETAVTTTAAQSGKLTANILEEKGSEAVYSSIVRKLEHREGEEWNSGKLLMR